MSPMRRRTILILVDLDAVLTEVLYLTDYFLSIQLHFNFIANIAKTILNPTWECLISPDMMLMVM